MNITQEKIKGKQVIYSDNNMDSDDKFLCMWCGDVGGKDNLVKLPIKGSYSIKKKKFFYKCVKSFDCYECCYAFLILIKNRDLAFYSNSETLLLDMYDKEYPNKKLIPANDYWLKKKYNGPLDALSYKKSNYTNNGNRIIISMSDEYTLRDY